MVSDFQNVNCRVPQGSILGLLLFVMYVNDIAKYLNHARIIMYADDPVIYVSEAMITWRRAGPVARLAR